MSVGSYQYYFRNCKDPDELRLEKYYYCYYSLSRGLCPGRVCDECPVEKYFNECMEVLL